MSAHKRRPAGNQTYPPVRGAESALGAGGLESLNDGVVGPDVGIEQLQAVIVAVRPFRACHDDLGFRCVADRKNRLRLDALANCLRLADEVVTGIAGPYPAPLGVRAEGQAPSIQHYVIRGQVEVLLPTLAALAHDRHALAPAFIADRLGRKWLAHFQSSHLSSGAIAGGGLQQERC